MTFDQFILVTILIIMFALFIWGRWRHDIVAMLSLLACAVFGLIPFNQVFSGFSHQATITIVFVLVISFGLTVSGAVENITKLITPLKKRPKLQIIALMTTAALFSTFINNMGALAIMLPIAIASTREAKRAPATVLMPLSFSSILGGLITLIGTPPNIIISSFREKVLGEPYAIFDFAYVGLPVAMAGLAFMGVFGWRLVKVRKTTADLEIFDVKDYLFKVKIIDKSKLINKNLGDTDKVLSKNNVSLISIIHKRRQHAIVPRDHIFNKNDILFLEGSQKDIDEVIKSLSLSLVRADSALKEISHSKDFSLIELIVSPGSKIIGRTVEEIRFSKTVSANLVAVSRQGKSYRGRLKDFKFRVGDLLLLHGSSEQLEQIANRLGCFPLAERQLDFTIRPLGHLALLIFTSAIALSSILPIQLCLALAALLMVLTNIIPLRNLYTCIDWSTVVLLGALIPVGSALQSTGITKIIGQTFAMFSNFVPAYLLVVGILVITMTLSDVLNNATTAVIMAPIALGVAHSLGLSPDPFLMAVAVGASCAFLTPIGHQNNAFVMGPGGYHFGDYWRLGLPLEIIIVLVASPIILIAWPLGSS